jgi:excisionase family DNA binding protein
MDHPEAAELPFDLESLLTADEVTAWLHISRSTFYRAVRSGELPAFKLGGVWRVDRRDIEELIADRKRRSAKGRVVSAVPGTVPATPSRRLEKGDHRRLQE